MNRLRSVQNHMHVLSCMLLISSQVNRYNNVSDSVRQQLETIVGKKSISLSLAVREQHGKDESYHICKPPDVVVFPSEVQQVSEVLRICNSERIPVIPFGTGTGLEGGIGALFVCICLCMYVLVLF